MVTFVFQLAHSLKFYKGDERIKEFIWDLVANSNEGELKNHTGTTIFLSDNSLPFFIEKMVANKKSRTLNYNYLQNDSIFSLKLCLH